MESMIVAGKETIESVQIENEVFNYFDLLFNGRMDRNDEFIMDEDGLDFFLNDDIGIMSEADRQMLEQSYTFDELKAVIRNLPSNESPGIHGLTNEFNQTVFNVIAPEYLKVQNCMSDKCHINKSMRQGVTRLIPKVSGTPKVSDLRPITMLVTDYGVKSRLITSRLRSCMDSLIKSNQLCCNSKRNILTGAHNIISTIHFVNLKKLPAALLSFDMSKAFDRCYLPYVTKVLDKMGFPRKLIDIIKDMHKGISTQFILNKLSKKVSLTFSVRQGDHCIGYVFVYVAHGALFIETSEDLCWSDFDGISSDRRGLF